MANKIGTAILELVTDITKMTGGLNQAVTGVQKLGTHVEATSKKIEAVGKTLTAAFSVLALGALGKEFLDFAGHVNDLSQRLKISTSTVQEWQAVFGASGVEIEAVAKASDQLTTKLVGGDKSAVGALQKMGLSIEALKAMKPEERFNTVADAVGKIQNVGEQLYASKTLFGKGGPELLAALDGHLSETIQRMRDMGIVIDEETIKAADDFGDQLGYLGKQLLGIVAQIVGPLLPALSALGNVLSWLGRNVIGPVLNVAVKSAMTLLAGFVEVVTDVLGRIVALGSKIPGVGDKFKGMADALKDVSKRSGDYMANLWKQTDQTGQSADTAKPKLLGLGAAIDDSGKKAKKTSDEFARLVEHINELNRANAAPIFKQPEYNPAQGEVPGLELIRTYNDAVDQLKAKSPVKIAVSMDAQSIEASIAGAGAVGIEAVGQPIEQIIIQHGESGFAKAVAAFPQILQNALTGGGGFSGALQAFGSMIGAQLGEGLFKAGGLLNGLGNKLAGIFGSSFGLALPGIGAALGSLVGPALAKLWDGIKHAFGGPSKEELGGRELEKTFEDSLGGFDKMMARIGDAYAATGRTREQAQADIKALLDAEKEGPAAVQAWIDKLKQVIDESENAAQKTKDALDQATADAKAAGQARMQSAEKEIQSLLDKRNALAQGLAAEADEEVHGVIQNQQEEELKALDAQLQEKANQYASLADETGQAMADAIVEALKSIQIDPVSVPIYPDYRGDWTYRTGNGEAPEGGGAIPMADGGFGTVTRPTLFVAGEAGPEQYAFSGGNREFGDSKPVSSVVQFGDVIVHAPDGTALTDMEQFAPLFNDAVRRNVGGMYRTLLNIGMRAAEASA